MHACRKVCGWMNPASSRPEGVPHGWCPRERGGGEWWAISLKNEAGGRPRVTLQNLLRMGILSSDTREDIVVENHDQIHCKEARFSSEVEGHGS